MLHRLHRFWLQGLYRLWLRLLHSFCLRGLLHLGRRDCRLRHRCRRLHYRRRLYLARSLLARLGLPPALGLTLHGFGRKFPALSLALGLDIICSYDYRLRLGCPFQFLRCRHGLPTQRHITQFCRLLSDGLAVRLRLIRCLLLRCRQIQFRCRSPGCPR